MSDVFLMLPAAERSQILRGLAPRMGRTAIVLEKDVWVCWVLQHLFTMPGRLPMAFKGGTSLSKVFRAIDRFSEDVDITLDYRGLDASVDPFAEGLSRRKLRLLGEHLEELVAEYGLNVLAPYFERLLDEQLGPGLAWVERCADEDDLKLRIHFPSALEGTDGYVKDSVLLELGGRNITEPNEMHEVSPDIVEHLSGLELPVALVGVLAPERTFWEKATLIHAECNRVEFRASVERLSRHWYDLARLADQEIGKRAMDDRDLLVDVVRHKEAFYYASYANYDACLAGQLRLIPDASVLPALRDDFDRMVGAGMFIGEPPALDDIMERLQALESAINR